MIAVKGLKKTYSLTKKEQKKNPQGSSVYTALNGVDFECQPGRIFGLLGPNGAGKTTALRIISTILQPTEGSVSVNSYDVSKQADQVRKSIGFLTGSTGLYHRLSAAETITYFASLYDIPIDIAKQRQKELFDRLEIHSYSAKQAGTLSTGMKQKLNLVRTLIHEPDVLILDEPTSGLDIIAAQTFLDIIREYRDKGKTVLFSSHIMEEVDILCDDLAILHKGEIRYSGTMQEFRDSVSGSSLVEQFIEVVSA